MQRFLIGVIGLGAAAVLAACATEVETGRASYDNLCAACHGPAGKGDGASAGALAERPADLSQLAAQNGGVYPRLEVMAKIDGYAKGEPHYGAMPAFWPLLEGRTVLIETGPGILTPTPEPLVALAAYIETLQE